jgi:hypothetical protein
MTYARVGFQVRIREAATLADLGTRVEQALECAFHPSEARLFAGAPALETTLLGLWITLSFLRGVPDGEVQTFVLMGMLKDDLDVRWGGDLPRIDMSEFMLGVLRSYDSGGWYIPDSEDL